VSAQEDRRAARIAWSLVGVYVAGAITGFWLVEQVRSQWAPTVGFLAAAWEGLGLIGIFALFAVVGALIASRRARQPIGWLMLGSALAWMALLPSTGHALVTIGGSPAAPPVSGLVASWLAAPFAFLGMILGVVVLLLRFPDGRLLSARWRPVEWAAVAVFALVVVAVSVMQARLAGQLHLVGHESVVVYDVANPLFPSWLDPAVATALETVGAVGMVMLILAAVLSVVVRYRRTRGVERQQIKWLTIAGAVTGSMLVAMVAVGLVTGDWPPSFLWGLLYLSLAGFPIAVGLAVLRYRLYEIDRLISRTVSYALVIVVLGAVYAAGIVGLGSGLAALTGEEGGDLVVAASVLAVVGAFGPVRSRVQRAVDRRFNRSGYAARLAVEAFAQEIRDEVELDAIRRAAGATATVAVQPARLSVWLARTGGEQ
jgi:hypothetical protein